MAGDPRPLFPFVAMATWDNHLAIDSARRIAELPLRYLATGHGRVLADPADQLANAICRAVKKNES